MLFSASQISLFSARCLLLGGGAGGVLRAVSSHTGFFYSLVFASTSVSVDVRSTLALVA